PETPDNLEIPLESGNHQDLLEQLRGLRQRIEIAMREPAWNQIIACTLRSRFRQNRSLDFPESIPVHETADRHGHPMEQAERFLHLGSAQIEIAVLQAQIFGSQNLVFNGKRRGF